jgi:hypothetical protein
MAVGSESRHEVPPKGRGDDRRRWEWSELVEFKLSSPEKVKAHAYIAYRRDPADDAPPLPDVI